MFCISLARVLLFLCLLAPLYSQTDGSVDTKLCGGCHSGIVRSYRQTGMGRSFYRLVPANRIEDFTERNHFYHAASDTHYVMLLRGDRVVQRRYQLGADGQETNVDEKSVDFVMGSGAHARTYLHQTARGTLMELPLGWYAEKGGYWAMSPGYDSPAHAGSQRLIGYDCMFCHNSYPQTPGAKDRFGDTPRFTGRLPEEIDCQRCHGPGQAHLAAASRAGAAAEAVRRAILNPARLPAERQMETCLQCHLQPDSFHPTLDFKRYGRGYFSYQPGEPLQDFLTFFDTSARESAERFQITSSAYRLRQSACFLKSAGKLQCTTCHNPHDVRHGAEAAGSYNAVCRQCHAGVLQRLIASGRHTAAAECIDCHMPKRRTQDVVHVVMTDHLIQRQRPAGDLLAELAERQDVESAAAAVPYYPRKLPQSAEGRLTMAVAQVRANANSKQNLSQLARLLKAEPPAAPDPYFELAEGYRHSGQLTEAVRWYTEALRLDSQYLSAMLGLSAAWNDLGQRAQALDLLQKAASLAPSDARIWNALGRVEVDLNQPEQAAAAFRKAMALDPDDAAPHYSAGILLARTGDAAQAEKELREAIRIQPNSGEAHGELATLLSLQGNFEQAAGEFGRSVVLHPADVSIRLRYAALLYTLRRDDEAQQQAEAALRVQPGSAEGHHVRGNVLERKGDLREAIREYREAVRLKPEMSRAQLDLGAVLAETGDKAGAAPHLKLASTSDDVNVRRLALQLLEEVKAR